MHRDISPCISPPVPCCLVFRVDSPSRLISIDPFYTLRSNPVRFFILSSVSVPPQICLCIDPILDRRLLLLRENHEKINFKLDLNRITYKGRSGSTTRHVTLHRMRWTVRWRGRYNELIITSLVQRASHFVRKTMHGGQTGKRARKNQRIFFFSHRLGFLSRGATRNARRIHVNGPSG